MEQIPIQNVLIVLVVATIVTGLVTWTVSSLNLGLRVRGFGSAYIAAIVITIIGMVIRFVLAAIGVPGLGGIIGFVERLVVAAVVLMIADKLLPGLTVRGFKGAIVAALAISVINWVLGLFFTAGGIGTPA